MPPQPSQALCLGGLEACMSTRKPWPRSNWASAILALHYVVALATRYASVSSRTCRLPAAIGPALLVSTDRTPMWHGTLLEVAHPLSSGC